MLFDNASIAVALYAVAVAARPRNRSFTYGYGRFEVLAGFANGRDAQPALVIGRHYVTERDSAPVQYNGIVYNTAGTCRLRYSG